VSLLYSKDSRVEAEFVKARFQKNKLECKAVTEHGTVVDVCML
jgi:hypothetical protein